eukprot:1176671-Prorocentrum_minimum.AAC.3
MAYSLKLLSFCYSYCSYYPHPGTAPGCCRILRRPPADAPGTPPPVTSPPAHNIPQTEPLKTTASGCQTTASGFKTRSDIASSET